MNGKARALLVVGCGGVLGVSASLLRAGFGDGDRHLGHRQVEVVAEANAGRNAASGAEHDVQPKIRIAGRSAAHGPPPIIFVDGMRMEWGESDMEALDPNDIDRVEVVKGAASKRMLGEEGANGVVSIFTKSNKAEGQASPIIFVDGVRMEWGESDMEALDPDDIDRVEVVKGAASKRIFGEEGANGVIHIFTKSGKAEGR